ncbi:MAG: hypothetical protein R2881_04880 [Eubacteriales bacterium]
MTNETAAYLKLLLHGGLKDVFFQQLEEMLNDAPVLEGVLLELSYIDDDIERAISCLNDYLLGKRVDYDSVAEMIRTQVWDLFCNRRLRQSEVVSALCCMAENTGFETVQPWCSMLVMESYYCLAVQGNMDANRFNEAFLRVSA